MRFKYRILRYGLLRRFRRGIKLSLLISFKCNFNCPQCSLKLPSGGNYPHCGNEIGLKGWINFVNKFPIKIQEIRITGGEPSLIKWMPDLVNYALSKGIFVLLYTNLSMPYTIHQIKASSKFRILACYYKDVTFSKYWFTNAYKNLSKIYRINIDELATNELDFSRTKQYATAEDMKKIHKNKLRIGPDGKIFTNCFDRALYYSA